MLRAACYVWRRVFPLRFSLKNSLYTNLYYNYTSLYIYTPLHTRHQQTNHGESSPYHVDRFSFFPNELEAFTPAGLGPSLHHFVAPRSQVQVALESPAQQWLKKETSTQRRRQDETRRSERQKECLDRVKSFWFGAGTQIHQVPRPEVVKVSRRKIGGFIVSLRSWSEI